MTEAADGKAALAALTAAGFDGVVSDARLPDTAGMALYQRLAPGQRFVLISGSATDADITAFRERTGVVVLQKPFELEELGKVLAG